jgi:hypothetical protein
MWLWYDLMGIMTKSTAIVGEERSVSEVNEEVFGPSPYLSTVLNHHPLLKIWY